jgi:hypothetical protein
MRGSTAAKPPRRSGDAARVGPFGEARPFRPTRRGVAPSHASSERRRPPPSAGHTAAGSGCAGPRRPGAAVSGRSRRSAARPARAVQAPAPHQTCARATRAGTRAGLIRFPVGSTLTISVRRPARAGGEVGVEAGHIRPAAVTDTTMRTLRIGPPLRASAAGCDDWDVTIPAARLAGVDHPQREHGLVAAGRADAAGTAGAGTARAVSGPGRPGPGHPRTHAGGTVRRTASGHCGILTHPFAEAPNHPGLARVPTGVPEGEPIGTRGDPSPSGRPRPVGEGSGPGSRVQG